MTEAAGQENHVARDAHMLGPGRKRILALGGCGTKGIIELAFLARVEALLRDHPGSGGLDEA